MPNTNNVAAQILAATPLRPALALLLGSGFASLRGLIRPELKIPYADLPGFLPAGVDGHQGDLVVGRFESLPLLLLCGRSHFYEGFSLAEITFPVRVLAACGVKALVLTNAAGGINRRYRSGDFMALTDHLNLMGASPLRGSPASGRPCFLDLTQTYDPELNRIFADVARSVPLRLHFGVYAAVAGPSYETPAEIRALARLGADAVGMSTVPEAIVARQCGLRLAAISCITNPASGLGSSAISHREVLATGERVKEQAHLLLAGFVRGWAANSPEPLAGLGPVGPSPTSGSSAERRGNQVGQQKTKKR